VKEKTQKETLTTRKEKGKGAGDKNALIKGEQKDVRSYFSRP
jgi:hypothetical protein